MDPSTPITLRPIGHVESSLVDPADAPRQADEGAPEAWLVLDPSVAEGLRGLDPGSEVVLVTWLDQASRDVLTVHPRGDLSRPPVGVFATRSPHRPNPIGLHTVDVVDVAGTMLRVRHLEAIDGTPVLDIKPVLGPVADR
jgi:tRNA-Thr(GGU) m(6)t(6)A37 methyltransferase TsaA